jgi:DNA replication and repair protein RecF
MLLRSLELTDFRNYQAKTFIFDQALTVFIGPNTIGKTNIIESIYALSTGKSFRADADFEMVYWGKTLGRMKAVFDQDTIEMVLYEDQELKSKRPYKKKFLVNGVAKSAVMSIGRFPSVLFSPENIALVTGSPSSRRKYIDTVLSLANLEYRRTLARYEKALRQRNNILFKIKNGEATRDQLPFWDRVLIENGAFITTSRRGYFDFVNTHRVANLVYHVTYDPSVISQVRLDEYKDEEIQAKATLVGPHRDDFVITVSSGHATKISTNAFRSLSSFGSRGEQRLGVFWLKLAEVAFLQQVFQEKPLLLLDDIFSELDEEHRTLVLALISSHQTVMTSAEMVDQALIEKEFPDGSVVLLGKKSG